MGEEHPDGTRQAILDAALDLFARNGYDATALRDIATAVGFTKAALYYHFAAKDDLLRQLARPLVEDNEVLLARDGSMVLSPSAKRRLLADHLDVMLRHLRLVRFLERDPGVRAGKRVLQLFDQADRMQQTLTRPRHSASAAVRTASALGVLRRPIMQLDHVEFTPELRRQMVDDACMVMRL